MEWIKYHEAEKVFDLRTENSTYQMQVREYDTLVHLYYGCPVGDALITDRIVCVDRGFSGNPYEAGKGQNIFPGYPAAGIYCIRKRRLSYQWSGR